jgi:signal transduction histidine kinase
MPRNPFHQLRLEWKLPLAIGIVLLAVVGAVSWMAYREVADTAVHSTAERGQGLAQQLASHLGAQAGADMRSLAEAADDDALASHLRAPTAESTVRAIDVMNAILARRTPSHAVELRDAGGQVVLAVGPSAELTATVPAAMITSAAASQQSSTSPFVALNGSIAWFTTVTVTHDERTIGHVVEWRRLTTTPEQHQATLNLLGEGSAFLIGSAGGAWTDQIGIVPPPPINGSSAGDVLRYRRQGGARLGVAEAAPGTPWLVLIEYSQPVVLAPASAFLRRVTALAALLFFMSVAVVWLLVRRITRPLRTLTAAADVLSTGDYSPRVSIRGDDEVARLGSAFNHMADRVEVTHTQLAESVLELKAARERFIHAQRMEAVGQLAAGIAHDFNNLLTVILGEVDLARHENVDPTMHEPLDEIRRAGERATMLTRQLLAFSRRQLMEPSVFDLNELVADSQRMLTRLIGENISVVTRAMADQPLVFADRGQIEQVIVNLAVNARDAMPDGGQLIIETANTVLDDDYAHSRDDVTAGEYVLASVSDTGSGMTPDVLARVFEPFYTTKEHGKGTGLGLATSFGIVKQLGGHIAAYSEQGVGTTMRVYLPRATENVVPAKVPSRSGASSGDETILLVEDDEMVRKLAVRILSQQGYHVIDAADAEQALALLDQRADPVDMLLTDVVLPGMGGRELADRVAEARPGIRILFASGYSDDVVLRHQLIDREVALLQKPYTAESLGRKIREVLDGEG